MPLLVSKPKFAIVTPSYNQADFLEQTILSVVNQPYLSKYIINDGASSDASVQTLTRLSKSFSNSFIWQSKKDKGQSDAINQGFYKLVTDSSLDDSTICAYINSDDYYLPNSFEIVAKAFDQFPNKHWLVGDAIIINESNQQIQLFVRAFKYIARFFLHKILLGIFNPLPQPAVFFKLGTIRKIGLLNPTLEYVMDYEYWVRLYEAFGSPIKVSQPLAAFRIHQHSKGSTLFKKQFAEQLEVAKKYFKNPLVLWLQSVHNQLIVLVYSAIK